MIPRLTHFPAYSGLVSNNLVEHGGLVVSFGDERPGLKSPPKYLVRRDFNYSTVNPGTEIMEAVRVLAKRIFSELVPAPGGNESNLVIHVRSGDIYQRENVGNWGQPPFAYYENIIRSGDWRSVQVVAEDELSPVIAPIMELCARLSIEHRLQSSSLHEDLKVLVSAENLVVGRGSFAPAVAILAPQLKKLFFFEDRFGTPFLDPKVEVVRLCDRIGEYRSKVLQGNWRNSPVQRDLMVSYPRDWVGLAGDGEQVGK